MEIRCSTCRKVFEDDDWVVLDFINTLYHRYCYGLELGDLVKDVDTYKDMIEKYWFFRDEELVH